MEKNIAFVEYIKKAKILEEILLLYSPDCKLLTKNTLRIICKIVESKEIKLEDLKPFSLIEKTV